MVRVDMTPKEAHRLIDLCEMRLGLYPSAAHMPREEFLTVSVLRRLLIAVEAFNKEAADVASETTAPDPS